MVLSERPRLGERVVLVHVNFPSGKMEEDLDELVELSRSAGANIITQVSGTRRVPDAKYFVGSGKAEELKAIVLANKIDLAIINHNLSPAQERNLEKLLHCRVIDRTRLILDIFAQRARSFEGKLQVELAQLKHLSTRLVRGWTHLERQRGGIGLRGPGETQLETDRRLIRQRIKMITARLNKLRKQRELSRRARRKATIPTVALVGYTNAGKSTLFNRLTGAQVYTANQLFATLDPTLRRLEIEEIGPVIMADTVGFIRHLPHDLVEAFHATLEEVSEADLILHVVDAHDERRDVHIEQVNQVLSSIGAEPVPRLMVYNKIDLLPGVLAHTHRDDTNTIDRVYISAIQKLGFSELYQAICEVLKQEVVEVEMTLRPDQMKLRAMLYEHKAILDEIIDETGNYHLSLRLGRVEFEKLFR